MNVILIGGLARSGKDTLARIIDGLLEDSGYQSRILHFSTKLKEIVLELESIHSFYIENGGSFSEDNLYNNKTQYSRTLMQVIGTELFRGIDKDIWANYLFKNSMFYMRMASVIIIPDYRFPNEYEVAKRYSDNVYRIGIKRVLDTSNDCYNHSSETSLTDSDFDYIINNNGTVTELYNSAETLLKKLFS